MSADWQSWAAPVVVLLTAAIMARRLFARKKPGCGAGCGCAGSPLKGANPPSSGNAAIRDLGESAVPYAEDRSDTV